jgi:hypothetical protein
VAREGIVFYHPTVNSPLGSFSSGYDLGGSIRFNIKGNDNKYIQVTKKRLQAWFEFMSDHITERVERIYESIETCSRVTKQEESSHSARFLLPPHRLWSNDELKTLKSVKKTFKDKEYDFHEMLFDYQIGTIDEPIYKPFKSHNYVAK